MISLRIFAAMAFACGGTLALASKVPTPPLLKVLGQFTALDVPLMGPAEVANERNWDAPATPSPGRPGRGFARHPMF